MRWLLKVVMLVLSLSPPSLAQELPQDLAVAHERVWRAWFNHDEAALKELIPDDLIAINPGEEEWQGAAAAVASSKAFAAAGGRLVSLSFPKTRAQIYGRVAIVYTHYIVVTEQQGKQQMLRGRATEVFMKRNGKWVNPGWHMDSEVFDGSTKRHAGVAKDGCGDASR